MPTSKKNHGKRLAAGLLLAGTLLVSGCAAGGQMVDSWGAFFKDIGQQDPQAQSTGAPATGSQSDADPFQQMNGQSDGVVP